MPKPTAPILSDTKVEILIGKIEGNMATRPSIATDSLIEFLEGLYEENKALRIRVASLQKQVDLLCAR